MYTILVNDELFSNNKSDDLAIINPVVELSANNAGTFSFVIPPTHPFYDVIEKRKSIIKVLQNDTVLFEGVAVSQTVDFYKQKTVECEGCLTYFNDTIQRPARYQNETVIGLFSAYIGNHNAQVDESRQFTVGEVTVTDPNDSIYCYTNYDSTMESLAGDLIDDLGGYLRVRYTDDGKVLDYLASSPRTNTQTIRIGKNLMDLVSDTSSAETVTVVIPLGAQLEEQQVEGIDARVDIKTVNDGKDYIEDTDAIALYGRITKVVTFDEVNDPAILKRKGQEFLANNKFEKMVINATAFDLSLSEEDFMDFELLDNVRVVSEPHGLDRYFMITEISYNLDNPQNNALTLGTEFKKSISAVASKVSDTGKTSILGSLKTDILESAKNNATIIMENGGKGFVYFDYDENAVIRSIMIMDTNDPATATKRWVWNENGFGYETKEDGEWIYKTAMTMDGQIVADFITAGKIQGIECDFQVGAIGNWKITNGALYKDIVIDGVERRFYLQPANETSKGDTWIISSQRKTESGSFVADFLVTADGALESKRAKIGNVNVHEIGTYKYNSYSNVAVSTAGFEEVCSIALPAGYWIITASAYCGSTNVNFVAGIAFGTSTNPEVQSSAAIPMQGARARTTLSHIIGSAADTTAKIMISSYGSSANYSGIIRAIRIK